MLRRRGAAANPTCCIYSSYRQFLPTSCFVHRVDDKATVFRDETPVLEFFNNFRSWVEKGLSYRSARLHRLAESIHWNRLLGSLKILTYRLLPLCSVQSTVVYSTEVQCHCFVEQELDSMAKLAAATL